MTKLIHSEMKQSTVGQVIHQGITYDIDWMFRTDENGNILECEDGAFVFHGDEHIIDFCQPNWDKHGWDSVDDLMKDAHRFIQSGDMVRRLEEIEERSKKNPLWLKEMFIDG